MRQYSNPVDKAMDLFADMMIKKLEGFKGEWEKPWFTNGEISWPKNLAGREYNGMNSLMLLLHCEKEGYKIPRFVTFEGVQRLNNAGQPRVLINKGEKSFPVLLYRFYYIKKDTGEWISEDTYELLDASAKEDYSRIPRYRVYYVFNVEQTNLRDVRPEMWQKLVDEYTFKKRKEGEIFSIDAVDEMIAEDGWICLIKPQEQDACYYSIKRNEIVVPLKSQFKDGESFYGTLFHEMVHSTGAKGALNRTMNTGFGTEEYAREELVAELGAALVCQLYGIEKYIREDSIAYLSSWLKHLRESPSYIRNVLADVRKAVQLITKTIDEKEVVTAS